MTGSARLIGLGIVIVSLAACGGGKPAANPWATVGGPNFALQWGTPGIPERQHVGQVVPLQMTIWNSSRRISHLIVVFDRPYHGLYSIGHSCSGRRPVAETSDNVGFAHPWNFGRLPHNSTCTVRASLLATTSGKRGTFALEVYASLNSFRSGKHRLINFQWVGNITGQPGSKS
jgi:hypothetical protein